MTPFDEIVGGMKVESSLYARFHLKTPWGVRFTTGDQSRLLVVTVGDCWLIGEGGEAPVRLQAGACLLLKPGVAFTLADAPRRPVVRCETLITAHDGGLVEHGGEGAMTELVSGRFAFDPVAAEPLTASMPPIFHTQMAASHADLLGRTLELMGAETARGEFGAGLVIDRLGDALFIQALRAFCGDDRVSTPGWVAGLADKRLERAIRAVHVDLSRNWTVEAMAQIAGSSRSSFAARFKTVVGEAPLDYVTGWRIYRARVLLGSTDLGLADIADRVGYESEVSLSRAFRRSEGAPPGQWRRQVQARARDAAHAATVPAHAEPSSFAPQPGLG